MIDTKDDIYMKKKTYPNPLILLKEDEVSLTVKDGEREFMIYKRKVDKIHKISVRNKDFKKIK